MGKRKPADTGNQGFSAQVQQIAPPLEMGPARAMARRGDLKAQAAPASLGGMDMRIAPILSALAASLVALAPVPEANAQTQPGGAVSVRERARPDFDPLGLRFGGLRLDGQLNLSVAQTDNLFADVSSAAVEDTVFTIAPSARLTTDWRRHWAAVEGGARIKSHADFSNEDSEAYYLRAAGRFDIGSRSDISGAAGFRHEVEPRTDPDSPLTPAPVEYDLTEASLTATHRFNRFRVSGGVARNEYDFEGAQAFRNNEETIFNARLDAELSPRFGVLVAATTDERDYPNAPTLSSEGKTLLVGASLNLTDLLVGEVSVGQFERTYGGAGFDSEGLAVSSSLEWYITRLTTITLNARRNSEDVVGGGFGVPFVETSYGGRIDHELRRNIILSAGATGGERDYGAVDRQDEVVYVDLGADYLLNRRIALSARYSYDQVDSSGTAAYRDYELNVFSLGVSLRL